MQSMYWCQSCPVGCTLTTWGRIFQYHIQNIISVWTTIAIAIECFGWIPVQRAVYPHKDTFLFIFYPSGRPIFFLETKTWAYFMFEKYNKNYFCFVEHPSVESMRGRFPFRLIVRLAGDKWPANEKEPRFLWFPYFATARREDEILTSRIRDSCSSSRLVRANTIQWLRHCAMDNTLSTG